MGRLLIPRSLAKKEFGKDAEARDEVVAAWRKNIFDSLPAKGLDGVRLLKAYVTTRRGPRRTLFLLQAASGDTIFLFHRPKGDLVGDNMAYSSSAFTRALGQALRKALRDIESGSLDIVTREGE